MISVIKQRSRQIGEDHLRKILQAVDFDRQYIIKVTSSRQKFLNMAADEHIHNSTKVVTSTCKLIFGHVAIGKYSDISGKKEMVPSQMKTGPASVIKETVSTFPKEQLIRTLIIYQP